MGLVGRSHFDHFCAALTHDVRNAEGSPNFNELAPGDDHLAALGQCLQTNVHGRRIVVHHRGCFSSGELHQYSFYMGISAAPLAPIQIILKVRVAAAEGPEIFQDPFSQDGTPQVRMDDNTRGVDDGPQAWAGQTGHPLHDQPRHKGPIQIRGFL